MKIFRWINGLYGKNPYFDWFLRRIYMLMAEFQAFKICHPNRNHGYYVIQRKNTAGFFSDFFYVLGHMCIADKYGLIPFVDFENYPTLYSEDEPINGSYNSWEYYFLQTSNSKVVFQSPHVTGRDGYLYRYLPYYGATIAPLEGFPSKRKVQNLNRIMTKYVMLRESLQKEFDLFVDSFGLKNCLGVHVRGTDMMHTLGHRAQISKMALVENLLKLIKKRNEKRIFLCTDDLDLLALVRQKVLGVAEVITSDSYRSADNQGLHYENQGDKLRYHHKYLLGKEVLRDAYCLAQCRALCCGVSNVAYAAIVLNNNHYVYVDRY